MYCSVILKYYSLSSVRNIFPSLKYIFFNFLGDSEWSSSGSGSGSGFGEEEPTDSFGDIYFSTPSSPIHFLPDHRVPPKVSSASDRWQHSSWVLYISTFVLLCCNIIIHLKMAVDVV